MRKISIALTIALLGASSAAYAEEPAGAAGAAQAEQPPGGGAAGATHAEPQPAGGGAASGPQPSSPAAAHAEKHTGPANAAAHADPAYALKLAAAVRAHVPSNAKVGAGTASCRFLVTANGSTSGIACQGSSPVHSQLLQKAISSTKAPPPPGGSFSASQSVVFH
jgi:hypothetical protein